MLRDGWLCLLAGVILSGLSYVQWVHGLPETTPNLTGMVTSDAEGPMEGVLVSAKRVGGTITVTVVTDSDGNFAFPAGRLQPGKYRLATRAIGFDLTDPGEVELTATGSAKANLKLEQTKNLATHMMSAEWLLSVPGTQAQKAKLYGCVGCHSLQPVMHSRYDSDQLLPVVERMRNHAPPSSLVRRNVFLPFKVKLSESDREFVKYLATVNRSAGGDGWNFELKTFPRPKGKDTKVIITEYDLPRTDAMPHDAVVGKDGMVWYSEFSQSYIGRLDPRTGSVKEWRVPVRKPDFPEGSLDIQLDQERYLISSAAGR